MKEGDVYALDFGATLIIALGPDGYTGLLVDNDTCVYVPQIIDDNYLHSMRAVALGNLCEAFQHVNQSSRP